MRVRNVCLVFALASGLSAWAEDKKSEGFKIIYVDDLVHLQAGPKPVNIYDCNGPEIRNKEGIIPGAHLMIGSSSSYDTAKELPADKSATLVFYCHNRM